MTNTRPLTDAEFVSVLRTTREMATSPDPGDRERALLVRVMFATGVRLGEALSIRLNAVDLPGRTISLTETKGGRPRAVEWMPEFSAEFAREVNARRLAGQIFLIENTYVAVRGRPLGRSTGTLWFKQVMIRAGLYWASSHCARKTYITWESERLPLLDLQDQVGHTSWKTTEQYYRRAIPGRRYNKPNPHWRAELSG